MTRRITRDKVNGKLAGVCSGIGNYFDIDPVIIRILFILSAIFGAGILIYIICVIVIPKG